MMFRKCSLDAVRAFRLPVRPTFKGFVAFSGFDFALGGGSLVDCKSPYVRTSRCAINFCS